MAQKTTQILFVTASQMGIEDATATLEGLTDALSDVAQGVKEAFTVRGYQDYLQTVKRFGKALAGQLLVLQLAFGKLKVAIAKALAPVAEVVVPYLNQAIFAMIRFAGTVGQFLTGLMAGVTGNTALADSAGKAADAEDTLAAAAVSAGKAAKRSLMGFDELERLAAPTGSAASGVDTSVQFDSVSPQVQEMVDRILAPLLAIDLTPLRTALAGLKTAFGALAGVAGQALEWLWSQILIPFTAWVLEELAPALTNVWAAGLGLVTGALASVAEGTNALWAALQPVVRYVGEQVVGAIAGWKDAFDGLAAKLGEKTPQITGVFQTLGQGITGLWQTVCPILTTLGSVAAGIFSGVAQAAGVMTGMVMDLLYGLTEYLAGVFTGDWQRVWDGVVTYFKGVINGIIGLLNTMISRLVSALNAVIRAANKLSFTVPDWVPGIGGSTFGLSMKTVTAPQIPYLAQGAVLPANRPFLAMVGDQRHGTNVEAPLATIQEAVALVLEDQKETMMEGFGALVAEQRQTRQAIGQIQVGDSVIGRAAQRYAHRMAVVSGGCG